MKRALKKFEQIDKDNSGKLEPVEILDLAAWVWGTFHPGQEINEEIKKTEADKILRRCDKNTDGEIDKEEFITYYNQTATAMFAFHKARAQDKKK